MTNTDRFMLLWLLALGIGEAWFLCTGQESVSQCVGRWLRSFPVEAGLLGLSALVHFWRAARG